MKCSACADFEIFFQSGGTHVAMLSFRSFVFTAARRPATSSLGRFGRAPVRTFASEAAPEQPPAAATAGASAGAPAADTPETTIATLNATVAQLKDHLLRQMAETENVR